MWFHYNRANIDIWNTFSVVNKEVGMVVPKSTQTRVGMIEYKSPSYLLSRLLILWHQAEEVGHDVGLMQYHDLRMQFRTIWDVAFLVTGAQPAMAMESTLFCLTCVVVERVKLILSIGRIIEIIIIQWIGTFPLS